MTQHLSQVIAVEKDIKDKASQKLAHARGVFGNRGVLSGIARTYTPIEDGGEVLPAESTRVQHTVAQVLKDTQESLVALFDTTATKDYTNCVAKADIIVDGKTLLKGVPATYILFLEKQVAELLSFVKSIPTLDASEEWQHNQALDTWATPPVETIRSKKVMRNHVLAEATDKHPAQVQVYAEDIPAGRWKTIKYSGAMPATEHNAMIARIERLQRAIKHAREDANRQEVTQQHAGEPLLHYIFG
jgi:hypothetical protein